MIYRDYESSYKDLMSAAEAPNKLTRLLRVILLEVFKSNKYVELMLLK